MDDTRFLTNLRHFWDEIARGGSATPGDLDPELTALIRRLHATRDVPPPDPIYARRLREGLMHATTLPLPRIDTLSGPVSNGLAAPPAKRPILPLLPAAPPRWAPAQLVTGLLALMVLIGSVVAFSGRWGPQEDAPAILSAISGTPAAPESAAGSGVEFVWQLSKVPDRHFIELGRPAIDPEGNLWVPDAAFDQYQIIAPDGTYIETWGASGNGEGEFDFSCSTIPYGSIAFDGTGAFYVLDSGNDRIQKFGPDRTFLTSWGSDGAGDDQFTCPAVIVVDRQGRVYVSDREADKVVVFDGEGNWLDTWPTPPGPSGLAVDGDGNIWVVGYENESVSKFSPDGELLVTWEESAERDFIGPGFVAIDDQGRVFVSEHDGARVQVFAPDGTLLGAWGEYGTGEGEFMEPRGIALDGQGGAYVTEWAGNRVQKFQLLPPLVGPLTP